MRLLLDYWHDSIEQPDRARPVDTLTGQPGRALTHRAHEHIADFLPTTAS